MLVIVKKSDLNIKNFIDETPMHIIIRKNLMKYFKNIIRKKNVNLELIEKTFNNKHNINDIKKTISFINSVNRFYIKSKKLALLHCNTAYPTPKEDVCLGTLDYLMKEFSISTNYGLFNSDIIHSMIYTTTFLKKYNDLSIPIQTYREYKYMLDDWKIKMYKNNLTIHSNSIWTLVNLYNNMFYILTPHVIIWHSLEQHYIHMLIQLQELYQKNFYYYNNHKYFH